MNDNQLGLFDLMNESDRKKISPQLSNDWIWKFENYPKHKNGLKVFSCFACGGGSTMGYKLAGCEVLGCCEIDPKMNEIYIANHHPKYNYLMDIRDFNKLDNLPEELYNLDILDGSPPCTTFSMVGKREEGWGQKKKFREGQKEQTLDDLSFVFIETVKKLTPKVVIMENVEGLLLGEAFSYVKKIYKDFNAIGYAVRHWLLKGEKMGVPQSRHRVFFIAIRQDIKVDINNLEMDFNFAPIVYKDIKSGKGQPISHKSQQYKMLIQATHNDKCIGDVLKRINGKTSCFSDAIIWDDEIMPTIKASLNICRGGEDTKISVDDIIHAQTFPEDYIFNPKTFNSVSYVCGMSVPPIMIKRIVNKLIEQGVFNYKGGYNDGEV